MNPVNGNDGGSPYGWACNVVCAVGCGAGSAGCAWLCALDGPLPFVDASSVVAIATASGASAGAATGIAQGW
ncbi:hypothetical protein KLF35_13795 (plasmid) [Clostridium perfringens]|uniref:hypothetical protein n=1 Tax=Clostridium perfringens TaxID=1502 RepID=UPI001CCCED62|nr:hypothetical protein [Clostridium perfringens]UBK77768.1 hypothetical protein KLF35_13795 [Clostridium perfringens]